MTTTTGRDESVQAAGHSASLARAQHAVHDPTIRFPLWPPQTAGYDVDGTAYPLEVDFDYSALGVRERDLLFGRRGLPDDITGWSQLLPPLAPGLASGIGSTPLLPGPQIEGRPVYVKDESRNPTWSHKDRLNACTVSAAALSEAPGVVVASSGNHGASAAALAARAGLPCVVIMAEDGPPLPRAFVAAYGAVVVPVSRDERWPMLRQVVDRLGFQPLSNQTAAHTGHPFGPEGYKTIAYELFVQLGGTIPAAVFVPTGYAELLYGVWKGFAELVRLGVATSAPELYACEVAGRGVLAQSVATGNPAVTVPASPTDAYSVATTAGGYRGLHVMQNTSGEVVGVDDEAMLSAQRELASHGLWQELSGAISLAGARQVLATSAIPDGPVVCLGTSSGLKDKHALRPLTASSAHDWDSLQSELRRRGTSLGPGDPS